MLEEQLSSQYRVEEIDYFWKCIHQDLVQSPTEVLDDRRMNQIIMKLQSDIPIEYITGFSFFYDFKLRITEDVLIPRPETEELVDIIINDHRKSTEPLKILDIGTGSGCIALCLKKHMPQAIVTAIDVSDDVLTLAQLNGELLDLEIAYEQIDFLDESTWSLLGTFDIIVSNPPYIAPSERTDIATATLSYEPDLALYAPETDPTIFYRKIAEFGVKHLNENGKVYAELNPRFAKESEGWYSSYQEVEIIKDMQSKERVLRAMK